MKNQQQKELLSLTNDYVFRRIFGEKNLEALADFLSAVLDMPIDELAELEVVDPNIHRDRIDGKSSMLDLRVHTQRGEILNIEVQVNPEHSFGKRITFYNSSIYSGQLGRGEDYSKLKRTISIVITNFVFIHENNDCFNRFRWYNINNGAMLTDAQEINTLELAKLSENDDGTRLWQWLKLLMLKREDEMEELAKNNDAMKNVIVTLREMSEDEAERMLAEAREKEERDRRSSYVSGVLDGEKQGEARGIEIGEEKAKQETARRMKAEGLSTDTIVRITGLSEEVIASL